MDAVLFEVVVENEEGAHLVERVSLSGARNESWIPVCDGSLRERLDASIAETIAALRQIDLPRNDLGAHLGLALMYAYLAKSRDERKHLDEARQHLDAAVEAIAETEYPVALHGGFVGVAWSVEHLRSLLYPEETDDLHEEIDEEILTLLSRPNSVPCHDVIGGLAGIAVYALARLPHVAARRMLELILDQFEARAERDDKGTRWLTPPEQLPPWQRKMAPNGLYNLGMAHGIPGIVATLGRMAEAGIGDALSHSLLGSSVDWLLRQRTGNVPEGCFAQWIVPGAGERAATRAAWCYGDPGVGIALLGAARCVQNQEWEDIAVGIYRSIARRPLELTGVVDSCVCHGSAGLAHLFNRFYQATGIEEFAEASRQWLERTLQMRRPGEGIAGYRTWSETGWEAETGLLNGVTGIVLTYLAATTRCEPRWDELLMASIAASREPGP
jgi:lantibiotic modifying enzyme